MRQVPLDSSLPYQRCSLPTFPESVRRGRVRCFLAYWEGRRAHGARSQDSGLGQKLSTRIHGKAPFPIVMTCQLTRYFGVESNQISCTCSRISRPSATARLCHLEMMVTRNFFIPSSLTYTRAVPASQQAAIEKLERAIWTMKLDPSGPKSERQQSLGSTLIQ